MSKLDTTGIAFAIGTTFIGLAIGYNAYRGFQRNLEKAISHSKPCLVTANTIGDSTPEKFYQIGTNRAYIEIDGTNVEKHVLGGRK